MRTIGPRRACSWFKISCCVDLCFVKIRGINDFVNSPQITNTNVAIKSIVYSDFV